MRKKKLIIISVFITFAILILCFIFLQKKDVDVKENNDSLNQINQYISAKDIDNAMKELEKLEELNEDEELIKSLQYEVALLCMDDIDNYFKGYLLFTWLGDYKDSATKLKELNYNYVTNVKLSDENINDVISTLEQLGDYKGCKSKINETKYKYATNTNVTTKNYKIIITLLEELDNYKDSKDKILEIKYNYAISIKDYANTENEAMNIFKELGNYRDSLEHYKKIYSNHQFDGYWSGTDTFRYTYVWIFNGNSCYRIYNSKDGNTTIYNNKNEYYCEYFGNKIIVYNSSSKYSKEANFEFKNNYLVGNHNSHSNYSDYKLTKKSDNVELPKQSTITISEPRIGMTKEEVKSSTWGQPKKINKDTYSWGTHEQWVYDRGYIYFENGIVTSISER